MIDRDSDPDDADDPGYDPEAGPRSADEQVASPLDAVDSMDATPDAGESFEELDAPPAEQSDLREELRNRLGLSNLQWNLLVSVLIALPYPFFIYVIVTDIATGPGFLLFTLAYSLVAIVLTFYL